MANDIYFEIVKHCGVLGEERNGFKKELNLVLWNNSPSGPKYDIRSWDESHSRMTRGVTLTHDEAARVAELIQASL